MPTFSLLFFSFFYANIEYKNESEGKVLIDFLAKGNKIKQNFKKRFPWRDFGLTLKKQKNMLESQVNLKNEIDQLFCNIIYIFPPLIFCIHFQSVLFQNYIEPQSYRCRFFVTFTIVGSIDT